MYELPREAVAEAIVNAVVHRDYTSNASVEVMLFSDRLEVWNPGELPQPLTMARLRAPHASIPRNPLICDPMFLARYAEKAGSGILDMIALCRAAGLPEPQFRQEAGQLVQTVWRDWLTVAVVDKLGLNERQKKALAFVKTNERITNTEYQEAFQVAKRTAHRDLNEMVSKGVLQKVGTTGKGTFYTLHRGAKYGPNMPTPTCHLKGAIEGPNGSSPQQQVLLVERDLSLAEQEEVRHLVTILSSRSPYPALMERCRPKIHGNPKNRPL